MKKVIIYTDGCSKGNPGVGGYGIVIIIDKENKKIIKEIKQGYKLTTNNRMELLAGVVALSNIDENEKTEIDFYSDSKYLVDAFNQKWIDSWIKTNFRKGKKDEVKNIDLWIKMIEISKNFKINFYWVKGHNGDKYNERCDELANESLYENLLIDEEFERIINNH